MNQPSIQELNSFAQQWLEPETKGVTAFTSGPIVPEPSWLSSFTKPWIEFGAGIVTAGGEAVQKVNEQLPQRLFDWTMEKLGGSTSRTVQTGPGTTTTYMQPAQAGAAPANPFYALLMPGQQGTTQAPAVGTPTSLIVLIVIGVVLLLVLRK